MAKQKTSRSCFCWRSTAGLNQLSPNLTSAGVRSCWASNRKCHCAASAWLGSGCSLLLPLAGSNSCQPSGVMAVMVYQQPSRLSKAGSGSAASGQPGPCDRALRRPRWAAASRTVRSGGARSPPRAWASCSASAVSISWCAAWVRAARAPLAMGAVSFTGASKAGKACVIVIAPSAPRPDTREWGSAGSR